MLVECGVFCRPVTFTDRGRDMVYLLNAIVRSFHGLRKKHIALLQVKSREYDGHFVDILDPCVKIEQNSFIKVITYRKVPKY